MRAYSHKSLLCRQKGVAVITALLLTTLAITLVANLFWQQQVQVRSIENQRLQLQKQWIVRGALDLVRLIVREDALVSSQDHLGEPWATPLAATPINQYLDGDEAGIFLTGKIVDAQSRFNLTSLSTAQIIDRQEVATFARLLSILKINPELAQTCATAIAASQMPRSVLDIGSVGQVARTMPLLHENDLLAVPGFSAAILRQLNDYIVILPRATPVNINTASATLIAASIENLPLADATTLVALRERRYFRSHTDLIQALPMREGGDVYSLRNAALGFSSNFFLVFGKVNIGNAMLGMQSLIERTDLGTRVISVQEE